MKKLLLWIAVILTMIVAINITVRDGHPVFLLEKVAPWFASHPAVAGAMNEVLKPGTYGLWYLGFTPDSRWELAVATILSWWTWLTILRLSWSTTGRIFGFYTISAFHAWVRLAVPWRPVYKVWLDFVRWCRQFGFGDRATARWAGILTLLAHSYRPGNSIYLGRAMVGGIGLHQPVGIEGDGHGMLIGNTGSGKTRFLKGWIGSIPKEASALVIDCGGDTSDALVNPLRRAGHRVHVWDPFGTTKFHSAHWNLLDEITRATKRHGRNAAVRVAKKVARALVTELNEKQAIFTHGAREFMTALLLYVWLTQNPALRNMVTVRQFLTLGRPDLVRDAKEDAFDALLHDMLRVLSINDGCDGAITSVIARGAGVMKSGKTREGNPFRTSALVATEFIDTPAVAETMLRSDYTLEGLKLSNDCVFLAAPVDDIRSDLAAYMRVFVALTAFTFQNIKKHREMPCVMFLDEAPHIGVEDLPLAAANYRKHDIRLVVATQDLPILEAAYPKGWRTLMGSAVARIWLTNGEISTMKYMCEEISSRTVTEEVDSGRSMFSRSASRTQRVERPLLYLDQAATIWTGEPGTSS